MSYGGNYHGHFGFLTLAQQEALNSSWPRPIPVSEPPKRDQSIASLDFSGVVLVFCDAANDWIKGRYSYNTNRWLADATLLAIDAPTHWLPLPPTHIRSPGNRDNLPLS